MLTNVHTTTNNVIRIYLIFDQWLSTCVCDLKNSIPRKLFVVFSLSFFLSFFLFVSPLPLIECISSSSSSAAAAEKKEETSQLRNVGYGDS